MPFDSIHNYYEPLVNEAIAKTMEKGESLDSDAIEDVACVALNQLPARYVRHTVDMVYYMTIDEREKIEKEVAQAVKGAFALVRSHLHAHQNT